MPDPTLLDCTLRDGGYYTNWEFDPELVEDYVAVCDDAAIDVVELGYVRLGDDLRGSFTQLPDGLERFVGADSTLRFGVMVDAASFAGREPRGVARELKERVAAVSLPIATVRVAAHHVRFPDAVPAIGALLDAGFRVCANLMQIDGAGLDGERACIAALADLEGLDAVYLADSLGSMRPERVDELVRRFAAETDCPIGFHAHDNQGLALGNSLAAVAAGASWIDGTMCGMGRGAGNARTEQLLALLTGEAPADELFAFVARHFHPLLDRHRWGASVYYAIAGLRGIHPTYVQMLEEDASAPIAAKLDALRRLGEAGASTYRPELLQEAFSHACA